MWHVMHNVSVCVSNMYMYICTYDTLRHTEVLGMDCDDENDIVVKHPFVCWSRTGGLLLCVLNLYSAYAAVYTVCDC